MKQLYNVYGDIVEERKSGPAAHDSSELLFNDLPTQRQKDSLEVKMSDVGLNRPTNEFVRREHIIDYEPDLIVGRYEQG